MLSNIIESDTKALAKMFSNKKFYGSVDSDEEKHNNYLIDLISQDFFESSNVVILPKEIIPNGVTLDAFNLVYQKDPLFLPILLRCFTHTDFLREAKDDLNKVNQKLQDLMDKEIKKLQIEQETLREEIISAFSGKEVTVEQNGQVTLKSSQIKQTITRIKEIEMCKEHVGNLLSGKEVISGTYPKEYCSILNDELTKIMEKKLITYAKDNKADIEKICQSFNSSKKKFIIPLIIKRTLQFAENILVPELKPWQTVILDNASFHKSIKTRNLIEKAGCKVLFLPPYSPDLNPIEHFWFAIKHSVRKILPVFWPDIHAAIDFFFQESGKAFLL